MKNHNSTISRRNFMAKAVALTAGTGALIANAQASPVAPPPTGIFTIGPMQGYSPQIGTLVSMMNYNRDTIINSVKKLTMQELDFLLDPKANTIGALIMHLGATEKFYQANTFEGRQEFNEAEKKIWNSAMSLGDDGRRDIKGHEVTYYLDLIAEVRQKTLEEFKKKDDAWLMVVDPIWSEKDAPLNTYWKWFHVCEHESNHRGQMAFLKGRLPGAKPGKE